MPSVVGLPDHYWRLPTHAETDEWYGNRWSSMKGISDRPSLSPEVCDE